MVKRIGLILISLTFILLPFAAFGTALAADTQETFWVTNDNDFGLGSLYQAILDCNGSTAQDKIIDFDKNVGSSSPDRRLDLSVHFGTVTIHSDGKRTLYNLSINITGSGKLILSDVKIEINQLFSNIEVISIDTGADNQLFFSGNNTINVSGPLIFYVIASRSESLTLNSTDSNGSLTINGQGTGIGGARRIRLESGIVKIQTDIGIFSQDISITGGSVDVSGDYGLYGRGSDSEVSISGGTVVAKGSVRDIFVESNKLQITGGSVNARNINCDVTDGTGKKLYLTTVTVGTPALADTPVDCSINSGTSFQAQTDSAGKLYLWIPPTDAGKTATAQVKTGTAQYLASGPVAPDYLNTMTANQVFTVTFDSQGGSAVPSQTVPYNNIVTKPADPTRTGYTFGGWYKDAAGMQPWNFTTDKVSADTTLYAKWNINSYTVTFNAQGGSSVPNQTVPYNSLVTKPADPTRTGYTFGGWYKDAAGTQPWNFTADKVTADTTLYAKWEASSFGLYAYMTLMLLLILAVIFEELYFDE